MKLFQDIFEALLTNSIDCAVVPIENTIEGSVNEIYDLLLDTEKKITGEIFLKINHCLITLPTNRTITRVFSHPQALAQCRNYINKKILDAGAIASKNAAEFYNMKILDENIEDRKNNYTRFLVLSDQETSPTKNDR